MRRSSLKLGQAARIVLATLALLWAVHFIRIFLPITYGIVPRNLFSWPGIFLAPLFHGDWSHLIANSSGILTFGLVQAIIEPQNWWKRWAFLWIAPSILIWFVGRPGHHIGASAFIFAQFGHLLLRGFFLRELKYMATSAFLFFGYAGLLWGVLPGTPGVSWEGHLCGLLVGLFSAKSNNVN